MYFENCLLLTMIDHRLNHLKYSCSTLVTKQYNNILYTYYRFKYYCKYTFKLKFILLNANLLCFTFNIERRQYNIWL